MMEIFLNDSTFLLDNLLISIQELALNGSSFMAEFIWNSLRVRFVYLFVYFYRFKTHWTLHIILTFDDIHVPQWLKQKTKDRSVNNIC